MQPPTEKLHQIIARTALFVRKHGGQSEIVLRVKQGDNPTFGFLMPDHHLHAYFRFLVDHQELLEPGPGGSNLEEQKTGFEHNQAVEACKTGALSLLGSIYGSGEDEDGATEDGPKPKDSDPGKIFDDPDKGGLSKVSANFGEKDSKSPNCEAPTSKEKVPASKRIRSISTIKGETNGSLKKDIEVTAVTEKSLASDLPSVLKVETSVVEPPSDLKKLVGKIVEFILKNGKEFEAVVVEQDSKYGRFPFLLPSNQYYPYYLKALEKAQEANKSGKSLISEKDDAMRRALNKINKKLALSTKESDAMSLESASNEIPFDSDKKEKFKMVITKPKKDGPDPSSKPPESYSGPTVDANAAAAILQAVRSGKRYPNLEIISINGTTQRVGSNHKTDQKDESEAKEIVQTEFTKEQKLKAERLKRAKIFASMIKSGSAPLKTETFKGLSGEQPDLVPSTSGLDALNLLGKQTECSSAPLEVKNKDNKPNGNYFNDDENKERRSKRSYRPRSKIGDDNDEDNDDQRPSKRRYRSKSKIDVDEYKDEDSDGDDIGRSKKSSRSRSILDHEDDNDDHDRHRSKKNYQSGSKISSNDDEDSDGHDKLRSKKSYQSRYKNDDDDSDGHGQCLKKKSYRSKYNVEDGDEDEDNDSNDQDEKTVKKKHHSRGSSHHSKERRHKHRKRHSTSNHGYDDSSSDNDHRRSSRSNKQSKRSHLEREADLEEGEIRIKVADQMKATSVSDVRASSQQPEVSEVPDELRAKIRAMLMANM